ncbi:MAG TPA: MarR family winged helix-turn-helix transcriptional regulator [Candidatus Elarobacter sp.]|nr:MarR family winged helix-turn-helix transcriptional regulator [Candidatus Elarobacter sp.]
MDALVPEVAGKFGPLREYVGYALRRAQLKVFGDFIEALSELDLRPAHFSVLTVVDANPGVLQSSACAALGIQKANFVPLLDSLQRRGLLARVARDGRANGLHLTAGGKRLLARARRLHDQLERRITADLSPVERTRLIAALNRLAGAGELSAPAGRAAARRSPSKSAAAPRRAAAKPRSRPASDRA